MDWQLQKFSATSKAGGIKGRDGITSTQEPGPLGRGGIDAFCSKGHQAGAGTPEEGVRP